MCLRPIIRVLVVTFAFVPCTHAGEPTPLTATPAAFTLAGRDSWRQLIVTADNTRDLTRTAMYDAQPPGIVHLDKSGLVTPLKEGKATIRITTKGTTPVNVDVTVTNLADEPRINFANQITPIFTKFGCNAGGCHGKASGQNNFKLSLLGFEPEDDYEYLVKEARGARRVNPSSPAASMLLLKATGQMSHGGGKKLDVQSPYYRLILRWIEQGMPFGDKSDPVVTRIEVFPRQRTMTRLATQQLAVLAHLSDGSTMDVTRMTQFEANQRELADVSDTGLVEARGPAGTFAVMARYQSHVDVFRAMVPLGAAVTKLPKTNNFIDELVFKQLKKLGQPPSGLCDDGAFLRRVTIDIAGRLPTLVETESFLSNQDPERYEQLVDRLLESSDYADYAASKWSAILRNRRKTPQDDPKSTFAFHAWIRDSMQKNLPFDQFTREVLTATGQEVKSPAVQWYREVKDASSQLEDMAQLFLGQRIGCAKCHHHPLEKWSQEDYWGLAAFFSRVGIVEAKKGKKKGEPGEPFMVKLKTGAATAVNPRSNRAVQPTGLGAKPVSDLADDADPRQNLVDWMTAKDNPFFARTLANRYWKHFMGRGLVEPEDDMRVTNPPTNPELLDALARRFTESNYDLKKLVRVICLSSAYRLSSIPNMHNADDRQNYSRFIARRINAEVLFDAVDQLTLSRPVFKGVPAGTRAVQLPDNQFDSYFLSVFGRPDFASACECERSGDSSLAQSLLLYNSAELMKKIAGPRLQSLAKDKRPHAERLKELYLIGVSRPPTREEMAVMLRHIETRPQAVQAAYEDILWALVNTKEFLFNH